MKHHMYPKAIARIYGGKDYPQLSGTVRFFLGIDGVIVEVEVKGLPETESSFFGFHIHAGGSCTGEGFADTESHYNPGEDIHPQHAGDLPPLLSNDGKAYMKVLSNRFSIEEIIGRTVIIHNAPDDFRTQPSGNAGMKIACGVIQKEKTKNKA